MTGFDALTLEILWSRLITIVDEMAAILVRTSFSTVVGAANDFGCEVMDAGGRSLAHATRSMPVFNRTLPNVTRAVLAKFGRAGLRPGDVFIANDPWLNAGHHPDLAVMTPFFRDGRLMGIAASIAHVADLGGALDSNTVREAYEEGLLIPMTRLYAEGRLNEDVIDFIAANIRVPEMTIGDIHAQVAANQAGGEKILALMEEYELAELAPLASEIQARSEAAMRQAIGGVPDGEYRSRVYMDELDRRLHIDCRIVVAGEELTVDFTGSSPQQPRGGINCTWVYSRGQTSYGLKCILLPEVPSNAGCYRPIHLVAPEGSILNARHPASVRMRTRTGWYIHHALFAALAQVLPERVMAAPGLLPALTVYGSERDGGKAFHSWFFNGGGMGAGARSDGVSTCIYPSSASNVPVELFEVAVPLVVEEKEFLADSGGPGRQRGGLGLRVSVRLLEGADGQALVSPWLHGQNEPPFGLNGGGAATTAEILINGRALGREERLAHSGAILLEDSSVAVGLYAAGGGGFGPPEEREVALVQADVRDGLVSLEQAAEVYGVVLDPVTGALDEDATRARRQARRIARETATAADGAHANRQELPS
ncbi:MAG: hydantoinase B/oxoprolinase family protein [Ardenticatenaceae bacterium]|nr:hydantoinase B/oxoprolinase family protein [Ardenticatenaceae bacterium]